jgi:hypothetical protein
MYNTALFTDVVIPSLIENVQHGLVGRDWKVG